MLRTKSLRSMTDALVRECTEFADSACYLDGYSITGARLQTLAVPARILIADDDPMIPIADQRDWRRPRICSSRAQRAAGIAGF